MMKTTEGTTIYLNYEQKKVAFEDPREPRQTGTDGKSKLGSYMFIQGDLFFRYKTSIFNLQKCFQSFPEDFESSCVDGQSLDLDGNNTTSEPSYPMNKGEKEKKKGKK